MKFSCNEKAHHFICFGMFITIHEYLLIVIVSELSDGILQE